MTPLWRCGWLLACSGCHGPQLSAARSHTEDVCDSFVAEQRGLAATWADPYYVPAALGACRPTKSGAWAIRFDEVDLAPGSVVSARVRVEHFSSDGQRVSAPFEPSPLSAEPGAPTLPQGKNYVLHVGEFYTDVPAPDAFDYDSDGDPELLFSLDAYISEESPKSVSHVFTFRNGSIQLYGPAHEFQWSLVKDIDGDGRPDLIGRFLDVAVAAHSLRDGSFSLTDSAARTFAEQTCPSTKRAVFLPLPDGEPVSAYGPSGWNGACARLWGASTEAVQRSVDEHCAEVDCKRQSASSDAIIESAAIFHEQAEAIPPLQLNQP